MKLDRSFNVAHKLSQLIEAHPDKPAIVFPKQSKNKITHELLTYAEMGMNVNRLANSLRALGLAKDDRLVVMVPISIELYTVLIALLKIGAIAVFIDPWVGREQLNRCCELTEPKAFIGVPKAHVLRLLSPAIRRISIQIVTGSSHFFRAISLKNLLSTSSSECDTEPVNPNDPALITFTTGSTGFPKGAQRTHEFLLAQHQVLSRHLGLRSNDVDMPTLPVFVLNNLANGITSVIPPMNPLKPAAVNPALVVRQMQEFKVTTSAGSPAFFLPIAQYCLTHKIRLESVRAIFTGGAPVRPELIQTLTKTLPNGSAYVVYGSTEAEPISMISAQEILNETSSLTVKGGGNCVGKPVDEIEVLIIQIIEGLIEFAAWETLILPVGEIGEIVVAGHHVNKTYYKNPDAVRENKFKDSEGRVWHRTGDTGYLDQQGRIWLIGRVKNRVRRAHQTLHPLQIEPIIGQLDFVARSALIGISDETLGQKALLIVEPREKNFLHRLRWQDHWRKEIEILCQASQFPVDEIRFHQKIPIDSRHNAKIEYATLRKQYEA